MDIIYVRDIKSTNYMMLGVIDEATHLHIGILLDNRTPEHVSEQFQLGWCRSFGYPLRLRTDPDGSFRSSFERDMEEAGVYMDYVPAEAHHKIGLIERHNHTTTHTAPSWKESLTTTASQAETKCRSSLP